MWKVGISWTLCKREADPPILATQAVMFKLFLAAYDWEAITQQL